MAIRTIVTRGYGNGLFKGTISSVVLRGYRAFIPVIEIITYPWRENYARDNWRFPGSR